MKVTVAGAQCAGHGRCYSVAPDVYEADHDGFNGLRDAVIEIAPGEEDAALLGAMSCPEGAITVVEQ